MPQEKCFEFRLDTSIPRWVYNLPNPGKYPEDINKTMLAAWYLHKIAYHTIGQVPFEAIKKEVDEHIKSIGNRPIDMDLLVEASHTVTRKHFEFTPPTPTGWGHDVFDGVIGKGSQLRIVNFPLGESKYWAKVGYYANQHDAYALSTIVNEDRLNIWADSTARPRDVARVLATSIRLWWELRGTPHTIRWPTFIYGNGRTASLVNTVEFDNYLRVGDNIGYLLMSPYSEIAADMFNTPMED